MKHLFLSVLLLSFAFAQEETSSENSTADTATSQALWKATLPGGNYMVKLAAITSISNHAYLLDGAIVVTEVTIDTLGATVARFYQLTPVAEYVALDASNLLSNAISTLTEEVTNYTGIDPNTMVQKKYPLTTHAKTVEYQIATLTQLKALYKSLSKSYEKNTGRKFSIATQ